MIGKVIGNYEVTELIGSGGMGSVYRCVDTMLDRDAAVKVLHPELATQSQVVERFRSEAKVLARLSHPNIATVYSLFEQDDNLFMVLEYVPGKTLEEILREEGALDLETTADLMGGILAGVEHAHGLEIVHRDLKPANLILSDSGYVKVMDFGIARIVGSDRLTRSGHIVGTLEYMSPEQVQQGEADARSDLYAAGVVLYEMLTGRIPFQAESDFELMKAQLEQQPTAPRELVPGLPEAVEAVILEALAKKPDDRYQSAGEMREALAAALESAGGEEGAAAARKTRLAAPGPAATRLAGAAPEEAAAGPGSRTAAAAATAAERIGAWVEGARPHAERLIARARKLPWQYWVIGAAILILAFGLLLWPRSVRRQIAEAEPARGADAARASAGAASEPAAHRPAAATPQPEGEPPRMDPAPRTEPPSTGPAPGPERQPPARPQPPPPEEAAPPAPDPEAQEAYDSLQRSPFERFVDNYDEIERLVEDVRASGNRFQDDYRSFLRSTGRWKPAGDHRTAWDQLDDFTRAAARMNKDLKEVADEFGLLGGGRAQRWMRQVRERARDLSQMVSGDRADASLRRLRTQADEIADRANRIDASLRSAGVPGGLGSSWSRLRTMCRRVEQLFE